MCVIAIGTRQTLSRGADLEMIFAEMAASNPDGMGAILHTKGDTPKEIFALDPWDLIYDLGFIEQVYDADTFAIHFRLATHGHISAQNLHPFRIGEASWLMHNGTICGLGDDVFSDTAELASICEELSPAKRKLLLQCMNSSGNGKYTLIDYDAERDDLDIHMTGDYEKHLGIFCSNMYWGYDAWYEVQPIKTKKKVTKRKRRTKKRVQ